MFSEYPFSGLVLCYGPLALVILGFIIAAFLTDGNARRNYLRKLDPRPFKEQSSAPVARKKAVTALTPAGMVVTLPAGAAPAPVAAVPAPAPAKVDDLERIEGIGPKVNQVLQAAGIKTYAQLAAKNPTQLRDLLSNAGLTAVTDPTTWPEQAKLAASGNWAALEALQTRLRGGRRA
jgi:predicted flap endonuclease-1-like 5' DNA nuclease